MSLLTPSPSLFPPPLSPPFFSPSPFFFRVGDINGDNIFDMVLIGVSSVNPSSSPPDVRRGVKGRKGEEREVGDAQCDAYCGNLDGGDGFVSADDIVVGGDDDVVDDGGYVEGGKHKDEGFLVWVLYGRFVLF